MAGASTARSETLASVARTPLDKLGKPTVQFAGHAVVVGPLSLDQWLGLPAIGIKVLDGLKPADQEALEAASKGALSGNIAGLLAVLRKDLVLEALSLLADVPEADIEARFNMVETLNFIDALGVENKLSEIVVAFRRVAARWTPQPQKLDQRSPFLSPVAGTSEPSEAEAPSGSPPPGTP